MLRGDLTLVYVNTGNYRVQFPAFYQKAKDRRKSTGIAHPKLVYDVP